MPSMWRGTGRYTHAARKGSHTTWACMHYRIYAWQNECLLGYEYACKTTWMSARIWICVQNHIQCLCAVTRRCRYEDVCMSLHTCACMYTHTHIWMCEKWTLMVLFQSKSILDQLTDEQKTLRRRLSAATKLATSPKLCQSIYPILQQTLLV